MRRTSKLLMLALVAATVVAMGGCSSTEPAKAAAAPPTRSAEAAPAAAPADLYQGSGPLTVENQVDVAAQREGVVDKIVADIGTHVRKGEVLAELDNRQLRANRDAAEAKVRSSQFELEHWAAEIKLRQADLDRDEQMFKESLITAKQVEHSRYSVEGALFERDREKQNLRNAQETLRSLELDLDKSRIVAPFDGVVARRYVRAGQRVAVNERLFWVTALSPISVKFTVPQELVGKIQKGAQVLVSPPGSPEERHAAKITVISPVVDPSSGTLEVQAQLGQSAPDLLPGMTVTIRIPKAQ